VFFVESAQPGVETGARLFRDPVAVGTLSRAALVEVIEQLARRAGLAFDPPTLPQRMAAEAGGAVMRFRCWRTRCRNYVWPPGRVGC
jgi:hypothetical protein